MEDEMLVAAQRCNDEVMYLQVLAEELVPVLLAGELAGYFILQHVVSAPLANRGVDLLQGWIERICNLFVAHFKLA